MTDLLVPFCLLTIIFVQIRQIGLIREQRSIVENAITINIKNVVDKYMISRAKRDDIDEMILTKVKSMMRTHSWVTNRNLDDVVELLKLADEAREARRVTSHTDIRELV